jgi:outer membrane receptor protein involved in Fe transport
MTSSTRCRLLATTLLVGASSLAAPAWAQQDSTQGPPASANQVREPVLGEDQDAVNETRTDTNQGEIVVTGSRIARPNLESNSPIAVVTGERLTANADVTLETFLNTLPQANPAGTTTSNNPGNSGQASIDLRGLGDNRNLVLIDGRRPMVSSTSQSVDLNTIPAALIERIDVITGGAGATYGADAVAGVVNLILKDDFEGLDVRATYANTGGTDAREFNTSAVIGGNFADGRGNAVLGFDYTNRQGLIKRQRAFAALATSTTTFFPEGLYSVGSNAPTQAAVNAVFAKYGVPAGAVVATSGGLSFNTDGTLFYPGVSKNPLDVQNFRYPIDLSVNTNFFPDFYSYNFDEVNLLVLPLERRSFMGKVNFEVSSIFQPFAQVGYTRYSSATSLAPTPAPTVTNRNTNDPARTASNVATPLVEIGRNVANFLVVPTTNPFIPADLRTILNSRTGNNVSIVGSGATEPFLMRTRTLGIGARLSNFTNEVVQYLGGARGDLADWLRYEAYYSEGRTVITNRAEGAVDSQRLQNLIEAADGGNSLCAGGYNPFGRNTLSAECIEYLAVSNTSSNTFEQEVAQGFIGADLAELPGGTLAAVIGAEYRHFNFFNDPGALSGPISGPNVIDPAAGENSFRDFFGELQIPILARQPWAQELTVNLGYRISRFKSRDNIEDEEGTPSTDHTYKAELSYAPIDAVRFRGSYQRAVRAPNFGELFSGGGSAPSYFDPCSTSTQFRAGALGLAADKTAAFCAAANSEGLAASSPSDYATYAQSPGSQLTILLEGNPDLRPEKADTITVGAVFSAPPGMGFLSTLRGSVDYYNIKIKDAIITPDPNSVLAGCFNYFGTNPNYDPATTSCQSLVRFGNFLAQVTNPATGENYTASNDGLIQTSGIDVQLSASTPIGFLPGGDARLGFDLLLTHLLEFKIRDLPDLPVVDYAGTVGYFGQGFTGGGGASFPKWRGVLNTTFSQGPFALNLRTRYIHKMENRANRQYIGETSFTGTPTVWYFDLAGTWEIDKQFTFRIGVNNLFNKQPPVYSPNVQSGTDPSLFDVIGRRFFVTGGVRF